MRFLIYSASVVPNEYAHPLQILSTAHALAQMPGVEVEVWFVSIGQDPARILGKYGLEPIPTLRLRSIIPWPVFKAFGLNPHIVPSRSVIQRWAVWRMREQLARSARAGRTIAYTRNENMLQLLSPTARKARVPFFVELHWLKYVDRFRKHLAKTEAPSFSECRKYLRAQKVRERECLMQADGILCLTQGLRRLVERMGIDRPLGHLPSGVNLSRKDEAVEGEPIDILYAGQFYRWKGVDTLIKAMRFVPEARLALVGGNNAEDVERIRSLAASCGVDGRISLLGQVPQREVAGFIRRARVCVIPASRGFIEARCFTSPIKLFEYAACRKPIVAGDTPSMRESLTHGVNAWLVRPDDPEAMAEGIRTVLGDSGLAARLGDGALALAKENSFESRAKRILEFCGKNGIRGRV